MGVVYLGVAFAAIVAWYTMPWSPASSSGAFEGGKMDVLGAGSDLGSSALGRGVTSSLSDTLMRPVAEVLDLVADAAAARSELTVHAVASSLSAVAHDTR